ncbi:MAG: HFX_2341 family transcriptional regulator domain-containing protein [Promethearchaeota archaeon]
MALSYDPNSMQMLEEKIHIVFNAQEFERITEFVIKSQAKRVYYFRFRSDYTEDRNPRNFKLNVEVLKQSIPNVEIVPKFVNYTDYFEVIQEVSKIIRDERKKTLKDNIPRNIYINLGTGSKISAIASMEASKLWNVTPYYVYSEEYNPNAKEGEAVHTGEMKMAHVPIFPAKKPTPEAIRVLKIIGKAGEAGIYKHALVDKLKEKGLLIVNAKDANNERPALYMALNNNYIKPLRDTWGCVEVEDRRRNQKITLTDRGREVLKIFKYYEGE